jgi:hypothetical protein
MCFATEPCLSTLFPGMSAIPIIMLDGQSGEAEAEAETVQCSANVSRLADPVFALTMGVSATLTRIQRDQREKYPERASEITYGSIVQTSGRRLQRWWNGDFQSV